MRASSFKPTSRLAVYFGLIFLAIGTSSWAAQSGNEKIVFSIPSRSIAAVDLHIAKERGFFREEGLDVDIVQIRGNVARKSNGRTCPNIRATF